jgi:hypothetical protein
MCRFASGTPIFAATCRSLSHRPINAPPCLSVQSQKQLIS